MIIMGEIRVTSSVLRQKADELERLNALLNSKIGELNTVRAELSREWQGDANQAFQIMFQRDIQQFIRFKLVINSYIVNMRLIAARYDQAESKNVALAGGVGTYPMMSTATVHLDMTDLNVEAGHVLKYGAPEWHNMIQLSDFKNSSNDFKSRFQFLFDNKK